jgi:hypothetical protein
MRLSVCVKAALISSALSLTANTFAANKGSLHVSSPETIGGTQLVEGDYTVRWEEPGPAVQLKIMQGNKLLATAPARIMPLNNTSGSNAVVIDADGNGGRKLSQIFFSGKSFALEIKEDGGPTLSRGN